MTKKSHSTKIAAAIVLILVLGIAGFGYFKQSSHLRSEDEANAAPAAPLDLTLLTMKPNDIFLGDVNALVTIVEYSSLSCPHCQHFHQKVLPDLEKEFIDTGKVKLILRHFPLNAPALKAADLVECAGGNGGKGSSRANFMKVLFDTQEKWAFTEDYLKNLKQIALVGGVDSAAFETCTNNKDLESKILNSRQEAGEKLHVISTPTFFVNGVRITGAPTLEIIREAIKQASASTK